MKGKTSLRVALTTIGLLVTVLGPFVSGIGGMIGSGGLLLAGMVVMGLGLAGLLFGRYGLDLLPRWALKEPVSGSLRVVSVNPAPPAGRSGNLVIIGVASALGIAAQKVEYEELCRADRWPAAGDTVPVLVDATGPHRLKIQWDHVDGAKPRRAHVHSVAHERGRHPGRPGRLGGGVKVGG
ncbi:MAG: hypothetical protein FWE61_03630 [Micrococcales bacterium]|nr:hypothetical protein [Micrococcales bacterium]